MATACGCWCSDFIPPSVHSEEVHYGMCFLWCLDRLRVQGFHCNCRTIARALCVVLQAQRKQSVTLGLQRWTIPSWFSWESEEPCHRRSSPPTWQRDRETQRETGLSIHISPISCLKMRMHTVRKEEAHIWIGWLIYLREVTCTQWATRFPGPQYWKKSYINNLKWAKCLLPHINHLYCWQVSSNVTLHSKHAKKHWSYL